jgi:hypothetical protein
MPKKPKKKNPPIHIALRTQVRSEQLNSTKNDQPNLQYLLVYFDSGIAY